MTKILLIGVLSLLLTACGQSGPLYLGPPYDKAPATETPPE